MIYLASPYSNPYPVVRDQRYRAACRVTAALLQTGQPVILPIAHGHSLMKHGLPAEWTFWQRYDRDLLTRCDEVFVLMLRGW